jgi:hypothetical protein
MYVKKKIFEAIRLPVRRLSRFFLQDIPVLHLSLSAAY